VYFSVDNFRASPPHIFGIGNAYDGFMGRSPHAFLRMLVVVGTRVASLPPAEFRVVSQTRRRLRRLACDSADRGVHSFFLSLLD